MRHLPLTVLLVCALLAGCGADDEPASPVARTQPPVGAPATTPEPTPTPTASPEQGATPEPTATPASPEDSPGGAGDEESPRIPVTLTLDGEGLTPPRVSVPAFFALDITVRNDLAQDATVTLGELEFTAPAGGRGRARHPGLPEGDHPIRAAGSRAVVAAGFEAGP